MARHARPARHVTALLAAALLPALLATGCGGGSGDEADPEASERLPASIAGIELGDERSDVEAELGPPDDEFPVTDPETGTEYRQLSWNVPDVGFSLDDDGVVAAMTSSDASALAGGVLGIGTTQEELEQELGLLSCLPEPPGTACTAPAPGDAGVAVTWSLQGDSVTEVSIYSSTG